MLLITLICVVVSYGRFVPIFWAIVFWTRKFTNYITPEMLATPKSKFFWMGAMDAMSGIMM